MGLIKPTSAGKSLNHFLRAGRWHYGNIFYSVSYQSKACSVGYLYASPFYFGRAVIVTGIGLTVLAGAAGAFRLGIYEDDESIHPGRLVVDAGEVLTDSPGAKSIVGLAVLLRPDRLYWLVGHANTTASVQAFETGRQWMALGGDTPSISTARAGGISLNRGSYGALPDPFPDAPFTYELQPHAIGVNFTL